MTTPEIPREEIAAAVSARSEVGREYDDAFVESIVTKVNETIDARLGPLQQAAPTQQRADAASGERRVAVTIAIFSLSVSIPLTAIVLANGDMPSLLIVWLGIALVNLAVAIRSWRH
jgi:hypothetical protein